MGRVLLLNATYEPLQLLSTRRAVLLLVEGRAEAVAIPEFPELCRSASLTVEIPSVMRLQHMVKLPSRVRVPPLTRRSVLQRDGHKCAYCFEFADTVDHVRPRSRGGRNEWANVVAACRLCNFKKGDRLLEEWLRMAMAQPGGF